MYREQQVKEYRFPSELVKKNKLKQQNNSHLITKIIKPVQDEQVDRCKYGIWCAHLRHSGYCIKNHTKNQYLFLNLAPPSDCLPDVEEGAVLTKKQKKQIKIIQKTINQNTKNGEDLVLVPKKNQKVKGTKQILTIIDQNQKLVVDLVTSKNAQEFYQKLNILKNMPNIYQLKYRAIFLLKKKKQVIFNEIIDKQYRIANRLIKSIIKSKQNIITIYDDINHDSLVPVREYYRSMFEQQNYILKSKEFQEQNLTLKNIFHNIFQQKIQYYLHPLYWFNTNNQDYLHNIKATAQFYNFLIPHSIVKKQPFNKFVLVNSQNISLTSLSTLLTNVFTCCFYTKPKAASDYPFGQLKDNLIKFQNWISKIKSKFDQIGVQYKFIFIIYNLSELLAPSAGEINKQLNQQKIQSIIILKKIFSPIFIIVTNKQKQKQQFENIINSQASLLNQ